MNTWYKYKTTTVYLIAAGEQKLRDTKFIDVELWVINNSPETVSLLLLTVSTGTISPVEGSSNENYL